MKVSTIPRNGLVGEWLLDGNALDTSGSGNNGTATNVTYANTDRGYQSQTGVFNGSNSYVQVADSASLDFTTSYTSNFWVKYSSLPTTGNVYQHYYKFNEVLAYQGYDSILFNDAGVYKLYVTHAPTYSSPSLSYFFTWTTPHAGKWYNICFTFSNLTLSLYIDNVLISSQSAINPTAGTGVLSIGRNSSGIRYLNGNIQSVRLYNRVLSVQEIQSLYMEGLRKLAGEGLAPLTDGLVAYYDFNGDANDIVGGNNGTVTGATFNIADRLAPITITNFTLELNSYPALLNDPSLVSYYRLEGNTNDEKGTWNGTPTAMNYSIGVYGQGGSFSNGNYINMGNSAFNYDYNQPWSKSFWHKFTDGGASLHLLSKQDSVTTRGIWIEANGGAYRCYLYAAGVGNIVRQTNSYYNNGTWNYVTITYDGSNSTNGLLFYVNGVLVSSYEQSTGYCSSSILATSGGFQINGRWNSTNSTHVGEMDDIAIFSRVLTQTEIANYYDVSSTSPKYKGANFNGGSAITAITNPGLSQNVTLSCWVKSPTLSSQTGTPIGADNQAIAIGCPSIQFSGGSINFGKAYVSNDITISTSLPNSTWTHIAATYNGTTGIIYKNGVQIGSANYSLTYNASCPMSIGRQGTGYYYTGDIDDVLLLNRTMSSSEMLNLYNLTSTRYLTPYL